MYRYLLYILLGVFFISVNYKSTSSNKEATRFTTNLMKICDVSDELSETSGIILYDSLLWTFNDSGGKPVLYGFNQNTCKIDIKIEISNVKNNDWEDIAQNKTSIFIGDFGNNDGSRKDLKIYILPKSEISADTLQHVTAVIIEFSYPDQEDFTPALFANQFDCEALIATEDSLYLFTKDWLNLKTSIYTLPAKAGRFSAKHLKDFNSDGLVTGADLNPENNTLVLCGYNLFYPFIILLDNQTSMLVLQKIELDELSGVQVEGIAFSGNNSFYITNEKSAIPQSLHKIVLNPD